MTTCIAFVRVLSNNWFQKEKKNDVSSIFTQMDSVSSELISIKPPSELTTRPRKLKDQKDWKGIVSLTNCRQVFVRLSCYWS